MPSRRPSVYMSIQTMVISRRWQGTGAGYIVSCANVAGALSIFLLVQLSSAFTPIMLGPKSLELEGFGGGIGAKSQVDMSAHRVGLSFFKELGESRIRYEYPLVNLSLKQTKYGWKLSLNPVLFLAFSTIMLNGGFDQSGSPISFMGTNSWASMIMLPHLISNWRYSVPLITSNIRGFFGQTTDFYYDNSLKAVDPFTSLGLQVIRGQLSVESSASLNWWDAYEIGFSPKFWVGLNLQTP